MVVQRSPEVLYSIVQHYLPSMYTLPLLRFHIESMHKYRPRTGHPSRARRRRLDRPTGVDDGRDDRVGGVSRGDGGECRDATAVGEAVDGARGGLQRRVLDHAVLFLA